MKEVTKNMRSSEVLSMMEEVYESKKIGEVRYDSSSNDIIFFLIQQFITQYTMADHGSYFRNYIQ